MRHPEARHDEARERAKATSDQIPSEGWRYPPRWQVMIYRNDKSRRSLWAASYLEATDLRDEAMSTDLKAECAWIFMRGAR